MPQKDRSLQSCQIQKHPFQGYPLVGLEKRTDGNQKWQDYEDGWYIYSYISNKDKIRVLNRLSDDLHLGLIIKEEHLIL